ncbi:MAG: NUDIX hydrolase [Gammaproteobacteria bacterium]|nr:NUDIX hydrolase [Gammaproteobacteria bacterium]
MTWAPRVTVAAVVERDQQFLCVRETILGQQVINQPAGHLEQDETLIQAVERETLEETGWIVQPESVVGIYLWNHPVENLTFLRVTFCCISQQFDKTASIDPDIDEAIWLNAQQLRDKQTNLRSPLVLSCIEDYLQGKRYPLDILSSVT